MLNVEKQAAVSTSVRHEERSYRADVVPEAEVESCKRLFAPVQPSHPQTTGLLYSPISSGMASPVSHPSQPQQYEPVPSHSPTVLPSQKRAAIHDTE